MASSSQVSQAMRRFVQLLVLLVTATNVAAQYTYIVPVSGGVSGFRSIFLTEITAFNPNATTATLRYQAVYPGPGTTGCVLPSSQTILPRALVGVSMACFSVHALVLTSDMPLRITDLVTASLPDAYRPDANRFEMQPVEVATDWIAPGTEAMIPLVRILRTSGSDITPDKANLVLVNPNDFVLTVSLHVERRELGKSVDSIVEVQPRSMLMTSIAPIPTPIPPFPTIYDAIHEITLRANGKFYAGASNSFLGSTVYWTAIPVQ
jgi:hypothetical protein